MESRRGSRRWRCGEERDGGCKVLREGEGMERLAERWLGEAVKVSDHLTEAIKRFNK